MHATVTSSGACHRFVIIMGSDHSQTTAELTVEAAGKSGHTENMSVCVCVCVQMRIDVEQ